MEAFEAHQDRYGWVLIEKQFPNYLDDVNKFEEVREILHHPDLRNEKTRDQFCAKLEPHLDGLIEITNRNRKSKRVLDQARFRLLMKTNRWLIGIFIGILAMLVTYFTSK